MDLSHAAHTFTDALELAGGAELPKKLIAYAGIVFAMLLVSRLHLHQAMDTKLAQNQPRTDQLQQSFAHGANGQPECQCVS